MKKGKTLGNVLFWMTLISPMISFALASVIGEASIFGVAGIIRYSWIMWLSIPVGVLSILIGIRLKKSCQNYKKNLVIAFICLPLILIFGSYRFVFNNISYDIDKISIIEEKTNIDFPDEIKVATNKLDSYSISYLKIVNNESKERFEQELETKQLWKNQLNSKIKCLLPYDIQYETDTFDYFTFYNITSDEYNIYPLEGDCECIFIAYDYELQRLIILDDYTINFD